MDFIPLLVLESGNEQKQFLLGILFLAGNPGVISCHERVSAGVVLAVPRKRNVHASGRFDAVSLIDIPYCILNNFHLFLDSSAKGP